MVGRLKPGVTIVPAEAALDSTVRQGEQESGDAVSSQLLR